MSKERIIAAAKLFAEKYDMAGCWIQTDVDKKRSRDFITVALYDEPPPKLPWSFRGYPVRVTWGTM